MDIIVEPLRGRWWNDGQPSSGDPGAVRRLVPCARASQQYPEGELAPLQLPVHYPYFWSMLDLNWSPSSPQAESLQTVIETYSNISSTVEVLF